MDQYSVLFYDLLEMFEKLKLSEKDNAITNATFNEHLGEIAVKISKQICKYCTD